MSGKASLKICALGLVGLFEGSCLSTASADLHRNADACLVTTIAALGVDPGRYEGRRICVSGFFGRIVPYGETNFELFTTRQQAEQQQADLFLDLNIRWEVRLQAELSRHSSEFARVEGIFEHDQQCWPRSGQVGTDYNCYPPRPMRLRYILLRFADGTVYRHPEFDMRVRGASGRRSASPGQAPQRATDRLPPPPPSSDDEDRIPSNPASPTRHANPPDDQAVRPQVEQLGLQVATAPPR